jgi:hypothetical protein
MAKFQCCCSEDKILGNLPIRLPYRCTKASALTETRNLPLSDIEGMAVEEVMVAAVIVMVVIRHSGGSESYHHGLITANTPRISLVGLIEALPPC